MYLANKFAMLQFDVFRKFWSNKHFRRVPVRDVFDLSPFRPKSALNFAWFVLSLIHNFKVIFRSALVLDRPFYLWPNFQAGSGGSSPLGLGPPPGLPQHCILAPPPPGFYNNWPHPFLPFSFFSLPREASKYKAPEPVSQSSRSVAIAKISGVHPIMMEKSALAGEGWGCTPIPFQPTTITYKVAV